MIDLTINFMECVQSRGSAIKIINSKLPVTINAAAKRLQHGTTTTITTTKCAQKVKMNE